MPDTETHLEGSCTKSLSHLSLLPFNSCYLLFCKCKGMKPIRAYFTHFTAKTFGICIWITLQCPSLSQLSLPQGGDISISPPCEEFSIYFIKAARSLLCQSAETLRSSNITFILHIQKDLKKVNHICSWHYTLINVSPHSSTANFLLSVFTLILHPLILSCLLICLWNIDF